MGWRGVEWVWVQMQQNDPPHAKFWLMNWCQSRERSWDLTVLLLALSCLSFSSPGKQILAENEELKETSWEKELVCLLWWEIATILCVSAGPRWSTASHEDEEESSPGWKILVVSSTVLPKSKILPVRQASFGHCHPRVRHLCKASVSTPEPIPLGWRQFGFMGGTGSVQPVTPEFPSPTMPSRCVH